MTENKLNYILGLFRKFYDLPGGVSISYDTTDHTGITILNQAGDFFEAKRPLDTSNIRWKTWKNRSIPILFAPDVDSELIKSGPSSSVIPYDILASSFYFLSNWQEYTCDNTDQYDRFPYKESLQYKLDIPCVPVVNYYFDILKTAIERTYNIKLSSIFSRDESYSIALTHDIDTLHSGWLQEGYAALKEGQIIQAAIIGLQRFFGDDPWFNLNELAELEQKYGISGSYFFLSRNRVINDIEHADYSISSQKLQEQLELLNHANAEIGIHGSYGAHLDDNQLEREVNKIGASIQGGRFHFLSFEVPRTPYVLDRAGLTYDSTLGFSEQIGFRNGIAHPFLLYDLLNDRPTTVWEIPLVIMDTTLKHSQYMGIHQDDVMETIKPVLSELMKFRGNVAILWHNSYYSNFKYSGWKEVLIKIIEKIQSDGGTISTALELVPDFQQGT